MRRNLKVVPMFVSFAVAQFVVEVILMVVLETMGYTGLGTLCGKRHSCGLTCHLCTALHLSAWMCWLAYASFSFVFGKDIPPLSLLGVSKYSHLRRRSILHCDKAFLLDVWTKVNLADYSENSGQ